MSEKKQNYGPPEHTLRHAAKYGQADWVERMEPKPDAFVVEFVEEEPGQWLAMSGYGDGETWENADFEPWYDAPHTPGDGIIQTTGEVTVDDDGNPGMEARCVGVIRKVKACLWREPAPSNEQYWAWVSTFTG